MKTDTKQSSVSNIFYMLNILWQGSPYFVIFTFTKEIIGSIFWTFFSVYMTEYIYLSIEQKTPFSSLVAFVGAMSVGHIAVHVMTVVYLYQEKQLVPEIYRTFYRKVIAKSISMEYARFDEPDFYDKYTRALNECEQRGITILQYCMGVAASIAAILSAVFIIADVDPWLLLFILPMVVNSLYMGKKESDLYYQLDMANTREGRIGSYAKRVFYEKKYACELRQFSIGRLLLERHERAYEKMQNKTAKIFKKIIVPESAMQILNTIFSTILPYLYIAYILQDNPSKIAMYIAMIPALSYLSWRTTDVMGGIVALVKENAFVTNLRDFLSFEPVGKKEEIPAPRLSDIEIKNMGFTYKGADKPTLHNVNMTIKKGEKIAIVGHNGTGKTTFVKLIMGLYPATEGEIKISGENINQYEAKSFHRRFGTVFQDLQVFALPLSHNVLMRKPQNEEERRLVEDSLRKAQFGEKLDSLKNGIDTMVTKEFDDEGMGLSGGEAQKIAIARVFARKPDIVILDEPSSALDPIAEYNMYQNMLKATDGETVIFISHRLSATRDADRIYLFEQGTIKEQGSHQELIALGGEYARMWKMQAENYLAGEVSA